MLAVQARLDGVQEQIEVEAGRLGYLATMTSTSTIAVTLRVPSAVQDKSATKEADEPSVIADAVVEARERGSDRIADAIVWLGGALPALVLLLVIGIVVRVGWRRHATT